MSHIIAKDYQEYPYSPEIIYNVLSDITAYKNWWPPIFHVKVLEKKPEGLNSKIRVWASGAWFRCNTTSLNPPSRVGITYYSGVVVGESYWDIEDLGNGKTKVTYSIDLEPNGAIPQLFARIINIAWVHSLQFKLVFKYLNRYLDSLKR
jgi:ribosome-associated toxin RatA of RatAB toxin-antitoxin module